MKSKTGQTTLIILLIVAGLYSCNILSGNENEESEIPAKGIQLEGTSWELVYIEALEGDVFPDYEGSVWEVPEDQFYTFEFVGEKGMKGEFFCNRCSGNYEITAPDSIDIKLACSRAVCGRSTEYIGFLMNAYTLNLIQDTLRLYYMQEYPWTETEGILHLIKKEKTVEKTEVLR